MKSSLEKRTQEHFLELSSQSEILVSQSKKITPGHVTRDVLPPSPMSHIELFAGCGGLSLGFKNEGFKLLLANELSPMAAETFAFNHLDEDLTQNNDTQKSKTLWLWSNYPRSEMAKRLREEPVTGTAKFSDLENLKPKELEGALVVGSVIDLNNYLENNPEIISTLKEHAPKKDIDVVSGGPPCQSFSMAGLRNKNSSRNQLPWEFARFVDLIRPKIALLENVTGILRPFEEDGKKFHAWLEVAKAFAQIGYSPICLHINAKHIGAGQNRPRFVMIVVRQDIAKRLENTTDRSLRMAILQGNRLLEVIQAGSDLGISHFHYFDIERNQGFFEGPIFKHLATHRESFTSVEEAIGDLRNINEISSSYVKKLNKSLKQKTKIENKWLNHELRRNNPLVQARFRLYQIITKIDSKDAKMVQLYLKDPDSNTISPSCMKELLGFKFLDHEKNLVTFKTGNQLKKYLAGLRSKKQTQKALLAAKPAPAALSIPDDACHWDEEHPRTLTVREMARIQSFPDWFEFRSKVTTGGKMRRYEVPQYTQVGNAVPPLLGKALAKVVKAILQEVRT